MAVLVVHVLAGCAGTAPARARSTSVAAPLPALTLPLIAGGTWSSASARGSVLVIDVWASWCKPCSKGFPKLDALAARRSDVVVVAISIDEDPAAMRDFIARFPLAVPVAHDREQVLMRPPLRIATLPTLLIVDSGGTIRNRIEEPSDGDYDDLEQLVERAQTQPEIVSQLPSGRRHAVPVISSGLPSTSASRRKSRHSRPSM